MWPLITGQTFLLGWTCTFSLEGEIQGRIFIISNRLQSKRGRFKRGEKKTARGFFFFNKTRYFVTPTRQSCVVSSNFLPFYLTKWSKNTSPLLVKTLSKLLFRSACPFLGNVPQMAHSPSSLFGNPSPWLRQSDAKSRLTRESWEFRMRIFLFSREWTVAVTTTVYI